MSNAFQTTEGTKRSHSHAPFYISSFEDSINIQNYDSNNSNEIVRQQCSNQLNGEQRIMKIPQFSQNTGVDSDDDDSSGEFVISRKLLRRRHIRKVQRKKRKAQEDEQRLQKRRGTEICHDDLKWGASKNLVHYAFLLDGDILSDTETGGKGGDSDPKYTKDKILP